MTDQAVTLEESEPVDGWAVLAALRALPISSWRFEWEADGIRHLGPMSQDFADAFGLGYDRRKIETVDAYGVLMVCVQALCRRIEELEGRLDNASE